MKPPDLTRRRLLGALPALVGGGMALDVMAKSSASASRVADVVIVGAGLAGLTAARKLAQAGRSVIVCEARRRVGGRTWSHQLAPGVIAELGGTWVGPTQDHIIKLIDELGLHLFEQNLTGKTVYVAGSKRSAFNDKPPLGSAPPDPLVIPDMVVSALWIDHVVKSIPVGQPWKAKDAEALDRQTFASWLGARTLNIANRTAQNLSAGFEAVFGAETREMSALFALHYIACAGTEGIAGTVERLLNTRGGAQERKVVEGAQTISMRMAAALGDRVLLSNPVRRVIHDHDGVTLIGDRQTVRGRHAIVAIPPSLAGRIVWEPLLPVARDQLTQRLGFGWLIKCEAVYDRPFWRDAGLNGSAVVTDGPARSVFDVSPPDGSRGMLLGFVGGDAAREYSDRPQALREAVIRNFVSSFGDKARDVREWYVADWGREEWTRGCPTAIAPPGLLTAYGPALAAPVGRIHWAGTETAGYWTGYMDGAVRSGERAAAEVLASG